MIACTYFSTLVFKPSILLMSCKIVGWKFHFDCYKWLEYWINENCHITKFGRKFFASSVFCQRQEYQISKSCWFQQTKHYLKIKYFEMIYGIFLLGHERWNGLNLSTYTLKNYQEIEQHTYPYTVSYTDSSKLGTISSSGLARVIRQKIPYQKIWKQIILI